MGSPVALAAKLAALNAIYGATMRDAAGERADQAPAMQRSLALVRELYDLPRERDRAAASVGVPAARRSCSGGRRRPGGPRATRSAAGSSSDSEGESEPPGYRRNIRRSTRPHRSLSRPGVIA